MHSKIIYPENISKPTYTASKNYGNLTISRKGPKFCEVFSVRLTHMVFFHYNRYDCKNVKKMENSRAAVWKCGGRQNKNSAAGDELQKTQQNEEIDG